MSSSPLASGGDCRGEDLVGSKPKWHHKKGPHQAFTRPRRMCAGGERERETAQSTACQEHEKDGAIDRQGDAPQRERRKK